MKRTLTMKAFDQLADEFINYLLVEKGLSKNTVTAYSRDLILYLDFLTAQGISDITRSDTGSVIEHLIQLRDAGLGSRSRARHLVTIRGFYKFLVQQKILSLNPAQVVEDRKSVV